MQETAWPKRGYFIVDLHPDENPKHEAKLFAPKRRPFYRFHVEVDALTDPHAVYDAVEALIRRENATMSRDPQPVVELVLSGMLPFNRYDLDLDYVRHLIDEAWTPLTTHVRNSTTPAEFEIRIEEESSRPELERAIVRELLERDARYRAHAEAWTEGALELKRLILEGRDPEAVIDHLRQLRTSLHREPGSTRSAEAEA